MTIIHCCAPRDYPAWAARHILDILPQNIAANLTTTPSPRVRDPIASPIAPPLPAPPFLISLSGGTTPQAVYEQLAPAIAGIPGPVLWFQGDERLVPSDHPNSNQKMIRAALFAGGIPSKQNFLPFPVQENTPRAVIEQYQSTLQAALAQTPQGCFDLILLGMGEDGHIASLFPGTAWERSSETFCQDFFVEKLGSHRLSLSFEAIRQARRMLFLVTGPKKADMVKRVLHANQGIFPAEKLAQVRETIWLLDEDAAAKLS
jgi:6-phosphogluconolactonase